MTAKAEARRKELLVKIGELSAEQGYPPTIRELQEALGYSSTASVYKDLTYLRESGDVQWTTGAFRTLRLSETS